MPKSKKPDSESPGCVLTFHVIPRSSQCSITELTSGEYKAKLTSPPVDGAANDQLMKFLAEILGTARRNIEIISGTTSRTKRVRIHGISMQEAENLLKH